MKITTRNEPTSLQNRTDNFFGGPRVSRRLQDDQLPRLEMCRYSNDRRFNRTKIGSAFLSQRSGHTHDDGLGLFDDRCL